MLEENEVSENKISHSVASDEVNQWLDKMKVTARKREKSVESIEELVACVMDGSLLFKDGFPVLTLSNPPTGNNGPLFTSLTFQHRYSVQQIQERTKQTNATGDIGAVLVSASLASGVGYGPLSKLYTADFAAMTHIVTFF